MIFGNRIVFFFGVFRCRLVRVRWFLVLEFYDYYVKVFYMLKRWLEKYVIL